jgi:hypothetical protein
MREVGTSTRRLESAVEATDTALRATYHTRLPSWIVARLAVDSASRLWKLDYEAQVVAPLRAENERLQRELRTLRTRACAVRVRSPSRDGHPGRRLRAQVGS